MTSTKYVLLTDHITRRLVDWWWYKNLSLQQSTLFRYIFGYWDNNQEEERSCGYKWEGAASHHTECCYMLHGHITINRAYDMFGYIHTNIHNLWRGSDALDPLVQVIKFTQQYTKWEILQDTQLMLQSDKKEERRRFEIEV